MFYLKWKIGKCVDNNNKKRQWFIYEIFNNIYFSNCIRYCTTIHNPEHIAMGKIERLFRELVNMLYNSKQIVSYGKWWCIIYVILLFISAFISSVNHLTFEISRKQETEKSDAERRANVQRRVNAIAKRRKGELKENEKKMINVLEFVRNALTQTHIGY